MKNIIRQSLLLCALSLAAAQPVPAQESEDTRNKAVITSDEGDAQIDADDISVIRFTPDGKVTLVRPWGNTVYDRTLRRLTFLRPLPGMLRLSVDAEMGADGANRALSLDDGGALRSTWEDGDKVYVYADENSTTPIGELTPQSTGVASATLKGDIDGTGLVSGETRLYFSTQPRATHTFTQQKGTLDGLFYATSSGVITIDGANATLTMTKFTNPQAILKCTLTTDGETRITARALVVTGGEDIINVTIAGSGASEVFVAFPPTDKNVTYKFTAIDGAGNLYGATKTAMLEGGTYYRTTLTMASKTKGTLAYDKTSVSKIYRDAAFTNPLSFNGDGTVTYSSDNTGVASVSTSGEVTITGVGTAIITATVEDGTSYAYETKTASYTLTVEKADATISYDVTSVTKESGEEAFTNELTNSGDGTVTYSSSDAAIASVDGTSGKVTIHKPGTAIITATVTDGTLYTYTENTASYTVTVSKGTLALSLSIAGWKYNGTPSTPVLTGNAGGGAVSYYYAVRGGSDYVEYDQGTEGKYPTTRGDYTLKAVVAESDNYLAGEATADFTISPATGSISFAKPSMSESFLLNGTCTPQTVTHIGDAAIFYFSPSSAVSVNSTTGEVTMLQAAKVTIMAVATPTAGSNYEYATTTASYELDMRAGEPTYSAPTAANPTYNGSAQALVNAGTTSEGSTMLYSLSKDGTYTTTIPTATSAGTYTVWYKIDGGTSYTDVAPQSVSATISPKTVTSPVISLATTSYTYDGTAKEPAVSSVIDGTSVIPASEYTVSYSNNTNAGTATVTISDKTGGNYTVSGSTTFTIDKAAGSISYATTSVSKTYDDEAFTNPLTKTGAGTVTYSSSDTNVATVDGTGKVTITGVGTATITATVADGTNNSYAAKTATYTVTVAKAAGSISYATTSVTKGSGDAAFTNPLTNTGDGTVTYSSSNTNVATVDGTGKVTIKGVGTATITATVAEGTNYTYTTKTATYTLTVYRKAASATTSDVGKLICTDGHIHAYGADATCKKSRVAVIAYVGSAGSVETNNNTYKGLAIAMSDANSGNTCQWKSSDDGTCVSQSDNLSTALGSKYGITNTTTLTSSDHSSHGHDAATAAKSNNNTASPTNCSGWFLPSLGQWQLIVQGLTGKSNSLSTSGDTNYKTSAVNAKITAAGGTGLKDSYYQSSMEYSTERAWNMAFYYGGANYSAKKYKCYVRSALAF